LRGGNSIRAICHFRKDCVITSPVSLTRTKDGNATKAAGQKISILKILVLHGSAYSMERFGALELASCPCGRKVFGLPQLWHLNPYTMYPSDMGHFSLDG
jgi:hypothetical protein